MPQLLLVIRLLCFIRLENHIVRKVRNPKILLCNHGFKLAKRLQNKKWPTLCDRRCMQDKAIRTIHLQDYYESIKLYANIFEKNLITEEKIRFLESLNSLYHGSAYQ